MFKFNITITEIGSKVVERWTSFNWIEFHWLDPKWGRIFAGPFTTTELADKFFELYFIQNNKEGSDAVPRKFK